MWAAITDGQGTAGDRHTRTPGWTVSTWARHRWRQYSETLARPEPARSCALAPRAATHSTGFRDTEILPIENVFFTFYRLTG